MLVCARAGTEGRVRDGLAHPLAEDEGFFGLVARQGLLAGGGQVGVVSARAQGFDALVLLLWALWVDLEAILGLVLGSHAESIRVNLLYLV